MPSSPPRGAPPSWPPSSRLSDRAAGLVTPSALASERAAKLLGRLLHAGASADPAAAPQSKDSTPAPGRAAHDDSGAANVGGEGAPGTYGGSHTQTYGQPARSVRRYAVAESLVGELMQNTVVSGETSFDPPRSTAARERDSSDYRDMGDPINDSRDDDPRDSSDSQPNAESDGWSDESVAPAAPVAFGDDPTPEPYDMVASTIEMGDDDTQIAIRPPAFAPTVRPGARNRRASGQLERAQNALEQVAQNALFVASPDGAAVFEITVRDELLHDVRCRIAVARGEVTATFIVNDANTKRLLLGERDMLRVRLEERGLRVHGIEVIVGTDADDLMIGPMIGTKLQSP